MTLIKGASALHELVEFNDPAGFKASKAYIQYMREVTPGTKSQAQIAKFRIWLNKSGHTLEQGMTSQALAQAFTENEPFFTGKPRVTQDFHHKVLPQFRWFFKASPQERRSERDSAVQSALKNKASPSLKRKYKENHESHEKRLKTLQAEALSAFAREIK